MRQFPKMNYLSLAVNLRFKILLDLCLTVSYMYKQLDFLQKNLAPACVVVDEFFGRLKPFRLKLKLEPDAADDRASGSARPWTQLPCLIN